MKIKSHALAINSTFILVSTSIINTIGHELAHYITRLYFHLKPELHHNYVQSSVNGTPLQEMLSAAAGPLFSLVFGMIILWIAIKYISPSLLKLFMLWLGLGSILAFMGYILIAPIAKAGDTGKVFDYFGFPLSLSIGLAIVSFMVIYIVFVRLASQFVHYKGQQVFDQRANAKQLFIYPIFATIILGTLVSLPVVIWISLLPTIFMPMAYFSIMGAYYRLKIADAPVLVDKISIALLIVTFLVVITFRLLV